MHRSTVLFIGIFGIGFFHLLQASPIGHVGFTSVEVATNEATTELALTTSEATTVVTTEEVPRPVLNETSVIDTLTTDISSSNETHIRQKRSCGCCGCCCCRPCCCCCCQPCCCCCRCCCCRCCCCRPCCCCCCRPCCCCGGCGCCGCGGGRRKRSLQTLTHKLMNKQAALLRDESAETAASAASTLPGFFFTTTTTAAPSTPTTTAIYTNAQIDAFGRNYANVAFSDFTNNTPTQYFYAPEEAYDQQRQQ